MPSSIEMSVAVTLLRARRTALDDTACAELPELDADRSEPPLAVEHHDARPAQVRQRRIAEARVVRGDVGGIVAELSRKLHQNRLSHRQRRAGANEVRVGEIVEHVL